MALGSAIHQSEVGGGEPSHLSELGSCVWVRGRGLHGEEQDSVCPAEGQAGVCVAALSGSAKAVAGEG